MLSPEILARYRAKRLKGDRADQALRSARYVPPPTWGDGETREIEGFTVTVRHEGDADSDNDDMQFCDRPDTFRVEDVREGSRISRTITLGKQSLGRGQFLAVVDGCGSGMSYVDIRDYARAQHTRHDADCIARAAIRSWLDIVERHAGGEYFNIGIVVDASRKGVKVGHASLWGICTGGDDEDDRAHIAEMTADVVQEALDDARKTIASLCACDEDEDEDETRTTA